MGNQLIPNTNINKEPVGSCGANTQWLMHQGVRTDKAKDPVSVFLFDKRTISKQSQSSKDEFINALKRDPQMLAKFKHESIVTLITPLLEDQKRIGFVTEPVKTSLNVLIEKNSIDQIVESELEIKLHILDIGEALSYLQNEFKTAHLAVSPENIYITDEGKWKLGGFLFSTQILQGDNNTTQADFSQKTGQIRVTPNLRFTAPEVTETPSRCTFTSDMFSLACLIFTLYKLRADVSNRDPYLIKANSLHGYREIIQHLQRFDYSPIPEQIRSLVVRMLHVDPNMRITAAEFIGSNWFKDPFVQTVKCLETIHQKDLNQQTSFLKGLAGIILKFEPKFLKRKMIPILNSLVKNMQLAANVLPVYFTVMEQQNPPILTREEFNTLIWPSIKLLVTAKEISGSALFAVIQKMEVFVAFLDIKEIETIFVPLLLKSLDCGVQKIQDLAIQQSSAIFDKIDHAVLKSQIMPKIFNLCVNPNIDLRKAAILMVSKVFHIFDTITINDQILPTLERLRKLNNNYAINMAMLTVFQGIAKDISIEVIANKVLVSLIPMLVTQTFSKPEYKAYLSTVYSYLKRVEDEQGRRFEGKPDKAPEDPQPELEKLSPAQINPKTQSPPPEAGQFGGDFAFLNSSVPKSIDAPPVIRSKGDFDFSSFNNYNPQASNVPQASSQLNQLSLDSKPGPAPQSSNRMSFDSKSSTNTFNSDNNFPQQRASVNVQKNPFSSAVPGSNKDPFQNPFNANPNAKSTSFGFAAPPVVNNPISQQNDPFKAFSQPSQSSGMQSFPAGKTDPFGQSGTQIASNKIQGSKPQNPFSSQATSGQNKNFNPAPTSSNPNPSSFDAFSSFGQFGSASQPQKQSQQPFSSDWSAPSTQPQASSNLGWDNLDKELENFSSTLNRPAIQPPKQENKSLGFDSNLTQASQLNNQQQKNQIEGSYQHELYQQHQQQQQQNHYQEEYQQPQKHQFEQTYPQPQEQFYEQQSQYQYNQNQQNAYEASYQDEYQHEAQQIGNAYYQEPDNNYNNQYNQQSQEEMPQAQEEANKNREAEVIATLGSNHPLRYLTSNMAMSAIRGKR